MEPDKNETPFNRLVWLVNRLRDPGGCPWDREQTKESLSPCVLEEAHEVVEAIADPNPEALREELGDLTYQVLFLAKIASERQEFTLDDVFQCAYQKLYNRHPHVFGEVKVNGTQDVLQNWDKIKAIEKKDTRKSVLDGLPNTLPALIKAQKVQERASRVGFDWNHFKPAFEKVKEELSEFEQAVESGEQCHIDEELGDLLFAIVNSARFVKVNPEMALQGTIRKFTHRFHYIEEMAQKQGRSLEDMSLEEMDQLWNEVKKQDMEVKE